LRYGARRKDVMVRKALQFEPDLLVYHVNVTTEYEDEREWERRERYASWHPGQWPDKLPLVGRIALSMIEKIYWRWLHPDIRAAFEAKGAEAGEAIRSKSDLEHWMPRMLATFEKTLETVQQAGVPLLVLTRANLDAEGKEMTDLGLDDEMKRLAARRPFAWLSTRAIFAGANPGAFFWDGSHWTPQGHDRAADALLPQALALLAAKAGAPAAKDCPAARR